MKKGDLVDVTIAGRTLAGVIELASSNGRSLAVLIDEGVPVPFAIHPSGHQCLLLSREQDGTWVDIQGGRRCHVKYYPGL